MYILRNGNYVYMSMYPRYLESHVQTKLGPIHPGTHIHVVRAHSPFLHAVSRAPRDDSQITGNCEGHRRQSTFLVEQISHNTESATKSIDFSRVGPDTTVSYKRVNSLAVRILYYWKSIRVALRFIPHQSKLREVLPPP